MLRREEVLKLKDIILNHQLQPLSFRVLSEEEKKKLLEKYNITLLQLPKILDTDPIAIILNAKEFDVIEITRKSPTAGVSKYYRVVVKKEFLEELNIKEKEENE